MHYKDYWIESMNKIKQVVAAIILREGKILIC